MGTSQNLPATVRVSSGVNADLSAMISERDMELCPEPISSAFPFLLIVSELGLQSAAAPKCSGAVMGMPQLWQIGVFAKSMSFSMKNILLVVDGWIIAWKS